MSVRYQRLNTQAELENLSKDTLIDLLKLYSRLYMVLDGFWYLSIKESINNEQALACDKWVWERITKYEMRKISDLLKFRENNVVALMKTLCFTPWLWNMEYEITLNSEDDAILTVSRCATLEALEREGEGREGSICRDVDTMIFQNYANFFDSNIQATPLRLPPRKDRKEGICCQWQFKLREQPSS